MFQKEIHDEVVKIFYPSKDYLNESPDKLFINKHQDTKLSKVLMSSNYIDLLSVLTGYSNSIVREELFDNTVLMDRVFKNLDMLSTLCL